MIRFYIHSFRSRIAKSQNKLVTVMGECMVLCRSQLQRAWRRKLYTSINWSGQSSTRVVYCVSYAFFPFFFTLWAMAWNKYILSYIICSKLRQAGRLLAGIIGALPTFTNTMCMLGNEILAFLRTTWYVLQKGSTKWWRSRVLYQAQQT